MSSIRRLGTLSLSTAVLTFSLLGLSRAERNIEEIWAQTENEVSTLEAGLSIWNEEVAEGDTLAEILASSSLGGDDAELDAYETLDGFLAWKGKTPEEIEGFSDAETQKWIVAWNEYKKTWDSKQMQMKLDMARKKKLLENTDRMVCKRADDLDLVMPFKLSTSDIPDPSAPVIRMSSGKAGDTGYDIYLTVDSVWVPNLDLTVQVARLDDGKFEVGDRVYAKIPDESDPAKEREVKAYLLNQIGEKEFEIGYEDPKGEQAVMKCSNEKMRHLGKAFDLKVFGHADVGKEDNAKGMAAITFELDGLTPLSKSWLVSKGISAFTNKENGKGKQQGTVNFKLTARGIGIIDSETGLWRVNLVKKNMEGLKIDLSNQAIINRVLSFFGSDIEKVVADTIWKQLETAVPKSFAALTSETHASDMHLDFTARITGKQPSADTPLKLTFNLNTELDMHIPKILDTLINTFNVQKLAQQHFEALVEKQDLKKLWTENQEQVRTILARYGVVLEDLELEEWDEEMIKEKLIEAASRSEDVLMALLEPFMKAQNPEDPGLDPFEGVRAFLNVKGGWGAPDHLADFVVGGQKGGSTGEMLHIPRNFFTVVTTGMTDKYNDLVTYPPDGEPPSSMSLTGLTIDGEGMQISSCDVKDFRVKTKTNITKKESEVDPNGAPVKPDALVKPAIADPDEVEDPDAIAKPDPVPKHTQIWKLSTNMKDFKVVFPPTLEAKVPASFTWPSASFQIADTGAVTLNLGAQGLHFKERELPPRELADPGESGEATASSRKGSETQIDGPLPHGMARPVVKLPKTDKRLMTPRVAMEVGVSTESKKAKATDVSQLVTKVTGSVTLTLNLNNVIRPVAANRPAMDDGYAFAVGKFPLYFYDPANFAPAEKTRIGSTLYAVVNCGYLRLINKRNFEASNPTNLAKFDDFGKADGQLEVDLGLWMTDMTMKIPEVTDATTPDGKMPCLLLPGRKYKAYFMNYEEKPMLCASAGSKALESLQKVQRAMRQQILRYRNDPERTKKMKFGTHDRYDRFKSPKPQFKLPAGLGTKPLRDLLLEL